MVDLRKFKSPAQIRLSNLALGADSFRAKRFDNIAQIQFFVAWGIGLSKKGFFREWIVIGRNWKGEDREPYFENGITTY